MRRLLAAVVTAALALTACSTGIDEKVHQAALDEARTATERADELSTLTESLQQELTTAQNELSTARDDLGSAESSLASQQETNSALRGELDTAEAARDAAQDQLAALAPLTDVPNEPATTLLTTILRERVRCGVAGGIAGFSLFDGSTVVGFDADFCRAIAAAVLGDADAVDFVPTGARDRFEALRQGSIDVLIRNTTWTSRRDAPLGEALDFGPIIFYDGQQMIGWSDRFDTASDGADLDGVRVCITPGTTAENDLVRWAESFGSSVILVEPRPTETPGFLGPQIDGQCDVTSTDGGILASHRSAAVDAGLADEGDLVIFPAEPLSREPLAPSYRQGDTIWADIVNWVVLATIIAEQHGVTSRNVGTMDLDPELERLFGVEGDLATDLGLEADAFREVIRQVGNYGEIYERNLGALGFVREGSLNALFTDGGLIYAPPFR